MQTVTTTNAHDSGYDLVPGNNITNPRIGRVYWDDQGLDSGLYVALDSGEESDADNAEDVQTFLARHGYQLDSGSLAEITGLAR